VVVAARVVVMELVAQPVARVGATSLAQSVAQQMASGAPPAKMVVVVAPEQQPQSVAAAQAAMHTA